MFWEAWTWWRTPSPVWARPLGYARESVATAARAQRCADAWSDHLRQSRAAVLRWAQGGPRLRVLGAGLLHDLPLPELRQRYAEIELCDVVFPPATRAAVEGTSGVALVETDITSIAATLVDARSPEEVESLLRTDEPHWGEGDLISLNVASQLSVLPLAHLDRRWPDLDPAVRALWELRFYQRHWERLQQERRALLIADAEQEEYDAAGTVLTRWNEGEVLGFARDAEATWTWDVAPLGELAPGLGARHRVVAVPCGAQARPRLGA